MHECLTNIVYQFFPINSHLSSILNRKQINILLANKDGLKMHDDSKLDFFMFFTLIFGDKFFIIDFSQLCSR